MKLYVLHIAYDGTKYAGWQRQPNAPTVAGAIEKALERLLHHPVKLIGAGRTDAGVHARTQIAHWEGPDKLPSPFLYRLNSVLPGDIRSLALYEGAPDFHARHRALQRTYRYFIRWIPDPFQRAYSAFLTHPPAFERLHQAAQLLKGRYDFSGFTKELRSQSNPFCEIYDARWEVGQGGYAFFEITANRFLRAMVRALVGAQLRLAQGKLPWETFLAALYTGDRRWGMHLAPPQGLFLWDIVYPPRSLYLLESYDLFQTQSGAAPDAASESASDSARSSAGSADGGAG